MKKLVKYINVRWLTWMLVLAIFISVAYDIRTGVLWTSVVAIASVYLYSLNRVIDRFFFDNDDLKSAKNTYDITQFFVWLLLFF